jgi:LacI family transcriptional regulator
VDVARRAGVSTSTAARALGGYGTVSPATAARVRDAADDVGYRANSVARSMITGRTMTLGVIVADVENEFFARLIRGFTDVAGEHGFDVLLLNTDEQLESERSGLSLLLERRVDGIAVAPASSRHADHLREAIAGGTALLLVDRRVPRLTADMVGIDSVAAARRAVLHLLEAGHRRIGIVSGAGLPPGRRHVSRDGPGAPGGVGSDSDLQIVSTGQDRLQGYRQALEAYGLPVAPELVRLGGFRREEARHEAAALLALPDPPTALFATDGTLCLGALEAVRDAGLDLPDDLSLIGFDDTAWAGVVGLTVMDQPAHEIGALAARRLVARVQGDGGRARRYLLPPRLVERRSVAAPTGPTGRVGSR